MSPKDLANYDGAHLRKPYHAYSEGRHLRQGTDDTSVAFDDRTEEGDPRGPTSVLPLRRPVRVGWYWGRCRPPELLVRPGAMRDLVVERDVPLVEGPGVGAVLRNPYGGPGAIRDLVVERGVPLTEGRCGRRLPGGRHRKTTPTQKMDPENRSFR